MSGTANGREVFVLGREQDGNREVIIVEDGVEYAMDADTIVTYSDNTAEFPAVA